MLFKEYFEILHAVLVIIVFFEHFSGKPCLHFLSLILITLPNMVHFVHTFSFMRA